MRRYALLLTAATCDRRLVGCWRDRGRAERIGTRLQDLIDEADPLVELDVTVGLLELEPYRGVRALLAWALVDPEVRL